jgi:hypothetical protein
MSYTIKNSNIEVLKLKKEILRLQEILKKNNIDFQNKCHNDKNIAKYYPRSFKSRQSLLRRVCIKCRQNLSLGKFSNIDRRKNAHESICYNCIKYIIFQMESVINYN